MTMFMVHTFQKLTLKTYFWLSRGWFKLQNF